jgi:hypothetical protein
MAGAKLEKTRYPGIYRRGNKYAFDWTDAGGKRHRGSAESLEDARTHKADREREAREGTPAVALGRLTLARYARELFGAEVDRPADREPMRGRYIGRRGAVRDRTREQYRVYVERFWLPELGARPLQSLTAADLRRVIDRLVMRDGKNYLADGSIRRLFAPMSALLATAAEEGLVVSNVARDVSMPSGRDRLRKFAAGIEDEDDESEAKALTREQLDTFLGIVDARHRTFFRLLASTGCATAKPSRCGGETSQWMGLRRTCGSAGRACGASTPPRRPSTPAGPSRWQRASWTSCAPAESRPNGRRTRTRCSRPRRGPRWPMGTCAAGR